MRLGKCYYRRIKHNFVHDYFLFETTFLHEETIKKILSRMHPRVNCGKETVKKSTFLNRFLLFFAVSSRNSATKLNRQRWSFVCFPKN
jgi:hypothetical protein